YIPTNVPAPWIAPNVSNSRTNPLLAVPFPQNSPPFPIFTESLRQSVLNPTPQTGELNRQQINRRIRPPHRIAHQADHQPEPGRTDVADDQADEKDPGAMKQIRTPE